MVKMAITLSLFINHRHTHNVKNFRQRKCCGSYFIKIRSTQKGRIACLRSDIELSHCKRYILFSGYPPEIKDRIPHSPECRVYADSGQFGYLLER